MAADRAWPRNSLAGSRRRHQRRKSACGSAIGRKSSVVQVLVRTKVESADRSVNEKGRRVKGGTFPGTWHRPSSRCKRGAVADFGRSCLPSRTSRLRRDQRCVVVERTATRRRGADVRPTAVRLAAKVLSGRKDLPNTVLSGRKDLPNTVLSGRWFTQDFLYRARAVIRCSRIRENSEAGHESTRSLTTSATRKSLTQTCVENKHWCISKLAQIV